MNILLICYAGMSTSLLVSKLKKNCEAKEIPYTFDAIGALDVDDYLEDNQVDYILMGPQARHSLAAVKEVAEPLNIPVKVIESKDYGMMNVEAILNMVEDK